MRFVIAALAALCLWSAQAVTLNKGNLADPDTLDPQKWFTTYEAEILRDMFAGLMTLDAQAQAIPGAAERYDISDDGLTLTFHLRADGRWSDGAPVTAEDFVLAFRRAFDPQIASAYANFGYAIVNAREVTGGTLPPDQLGVRAIDPLTFEVRLVRPSQTLVWLFAAYPHFFPVPRHLYDRVGEDWSKTGTMITNGAYALAEWVPNGYVRLVKNAQFFDAASVAVDEVMYWPTDDDAAAVKRFRAGELDINLRFPPGQYDMLKRDLPAETKAEPAQWISYVVMNHADPRFADPRVRRALSLAIDRETIVAKVLNNGELPAWSLIPPMTANFTSSGAGDFSAMPMAERQAEARRLLAEAGYDDGNPLAFTFIHRIGEANKRSALAMRDMWQAIGADVAIESNEVKVHYNRLRQKQFDVADAGFSAPPDAEFFAYLIRSDAVEINFGGWANAEYDRLTEAAAGERDPAKRGELYRQAEKIATDETALIPVYIPVNRALVQQWVKGLEMNPIGTHQTRWIRIER